LVRLFSPHERARAFLERKVWAEAVADPRRRDGGEEDAGILVAARACEDHQLVPRVADGRGRVVPVGGERRAEPDVGSATMLVLAGGRFRPGHVVAFVTWAGLVWKYEERDGGVLKR